MTDLMFQLLLFMLISTTLINPNALKLMLPKSSNQLKEKPYTTVSITKDLNYYVEMEPVSLDGLERALQAKMQGACLLYTSPSPRDMRRSRMPSSA